MGCVTELIQSPHSGRGEEFDPGTTVVSTDVGFSAPIWGLSGLLEQWPGATL